MLRLFLLFKSLIYESFHKDGEICCSYSLQTHSEKRVINATADSNIYFGGEGAILNKISPCDIIKEDAGTINRLIESCSYSKDSLQSLYLMFKKNVFAIGFGITSDYQLAEDCVAETFVRLAQVKRFDSKKGDGVGFIVTIARNVALELRRQHRHDDECFLVHNYGEADHTVENSIYINELLMYLNDTQRQIVVMKCCSELTFKQIAKIMKYPESTIKSKYKKAMAILQEKAGVNSEK